mgnify:CR=1 FL=1
MTPRAQAAISAPAMAEMMAFYANHPVEFCREQLQREPFPWQINAAIGMIKKRKVAIRSGRGVGKALALDTPIPTPTGWTTMGDLNVGDYVYDETGSPCKVTFATEVQHGRTCYDVMFDDGSVIVADADHRWLSWTAKARKAKSRAKNPRSGPEVLTTEQMRQSMHAGKYGRNHAIQVAGALLGMHRDLPIPPYTLGAWLGDGTSIYPRITTADDEVLAAIRREGVAVSEPKTPAGNAWTYHLGGDHRGKKDNSPFKAKLRILGVLDNKHIPPEYLRASIEQRTDLLKGLMDTDGSVRPDGLCEFTTTNESLFLGVYELVASLGFKPGRSIGRAMLRGRDCGPKYRVTFTPHSKVFEIERKLERQHSGKTQVSRTKFRYVTEIKERPSVPVRCITVDSPSHLFLCGDAMIPTHNTFFVGWMLLWLLYCYPETVAVFSAPTYPQLRQIIIPEIRKLLEGSIIRGLFKVTPTEVRLIGSSNHADARTGRNPESLRGYHAPNMVVIVDEASGVEQEFFTSLRGSLTGASNFLIYTSNPSRIDGEFYNIFHKPEMRSRWYTDSVSSEDVPIVDKEYIDEMKALYGEDSDAYRVHVLGEFPTGNLNSLIPLTWLEDARLFSKTNFTRLASRTSGFVIGVDVARKGEDSSVIMVRQGPYILADYTEQFRGMLTDELTVRVKAVYDSLYRISPEDPNTGKQIKPVVCVDSTGVGAGVYDQLRRKGVNVREVVVAEVAPDTFPRCHRLRDWLYWQIREYFNPENDNGAVILYSKEAKRDMVEHLIAEVSRLTYDHTPSDAIIVERKVEYKKRNQGISPDFADALMLTFHKNVKVAAKKKPQSRFKRRKQSVGWVPA